MNITYLFGAGASALACPVLKGQGEKMIELSKKHLSDDITRIGFTPINPNPYDRILFDIGYFGKKALEYGTIDTYAKKLYLSNDHENELDRLKISVSHFFTIWESMVDDIKNPDKFEKIDHRYISLLASILERTSSNTPKIKTNFKFVTWNYDLQFERAFKSFCMDHLNWDDISKYLNFRIKTTKNEPLDICHLNGYSGFYYTTSSPKEVDIVDRDIDNKDVSTIVKELEFTVESQHRRQISFANHINYAWESNNLAKNTRNAAQQVFSDTDILVIIGYSFPTFNKEVDQFLFQALGNRRTQIYYQDPNATDEFISILARGLDTQINCIQDKMDYFFLPYDY
jgi:hypothetical protein